MAPENKYVPFQVNPASVCWKTARENGTLAPLSLGSLTGLSLDILTERALNLPATTVSFPPQTIAVEWFLSQVQGFLIKPDDNRDEYYLIANKLRLSSPGRKKIWCAFHVVSPLYSEYTYINVVDGKFMLDSS